MTMPHENKESAMGESKDSPQGESKDRPVEVKPEDEQVATDDGEQAG